jgi:amino acid transporter
MSTTTLQPPATPSHEESNTLEYRALYSGALVAALLGAVSLFMLAVTDFLEVAVLVAVIPALGIIMSLFALRKINKNRDIYTGKPLALFGLAMSAFMLVWGVGRAGYIHATEVPDGYARISFLSLQPSEKDRIAGRPVPEETIKLMTEGQPVFIKGYIRPDSVQSRLGVNEFLLVRDSNQCCFGDLQSVQYFDQIAVKLEPPLTTDFTRDVFRVGGRLMCNPQNLGRGPEYPVYFIVADYVE